MLNNESPITNQSQDKQKCLACGIEFIGITNCPIDGSKLVPVSPDEFLGKVIEGKYEVVAKLGTGGMSVVYKARQILMDRIVAIKFLVNQDSESLRRFQLEAKLASSLSHPNIITIFDFGIASEQGKPFIVMDYLKGISLSEIIKSREYLNEEEAVPIFLKIIDALAYAHENSILHRDLKPANIMICDYNQETKPDQQVSTRQLTGASVVLDGKAYLVKLVDFGIAKLITETDQEEYKLTKTGEVFGSPIYMSPEQFLGEKLDNRSDIYSFGVVMYESLTGALPLIGKNLMDTLNRRLSEKPESFAQIDPELKVSPYLEDIVIKCLEKNINLRFQSMRDLQLILEKFHTHKVNDVNLITQKITHSQFTKLPLAKQANNLTKNKKLLLVSSISIVLVLSIIIIVYFQLNKTHTIANTHNNVLPIPANKKNANPQTLSKLAKADTLLAKGKIKEALNIFEDEYLNNAYDQISQNKILTKLIEVAKAYQIIGDTKEAININKQILTKMNLKYGLASTASLECLTRLNELYKLTKADEETDKLNKEINIINIVTSSIDDCNKLFISARSALNHHNINQAQQIANDAITKLKNALTLIKQNFAKDDLSQAEIENKIGQFYYLKACPKDALIWHNKALDISTKIPSLEAQLESAKAYIGIGTSYFGLNDYHKAKSAFEQALNLRQAVLGSLDPANIEILSCLSIVAENEHNLNKAKNYLTEAINIQTQFDPKNNELTVLKHRLKKLGR